MPPRTAFAFGFAAGLSLVYFLGLLQGLGLGTLIFRAAVGGLAFGVFCAFLVFMLGDPFEVSPPPADSEEDGDNASGESSASTDRHSRSRE